MFLLTNKKAIHDNFDQFTLDAEMRYQPVIGIETSDIIAGITSRISKPIFIDQPLSSEEVEKIRERLSAEILRLLYTRKPVELGMTIKFQGKNYVIEPKPTGLNIPDTAIWHLNNAWTLCEEHFTMGRPVYLNVYEGDNILIKK